MFYLVKTPGLLKKLYPSYTWDIGTVDKDLYLSFDDGPHPVATPFVLDELKKHDAKATFFCIGKNVVEQPAIYQRIVDEGHATGNHTHRHLNGWKTNDQLYLHDITEAAKHIEPGLFRPPYGRIKLSQAKKIMPGSKIIMWSVLSGDFDLSISKEKCLKNVMHYSKPGSIIVFHDSEKAFPIVQYVLPRVLEHFSAMGYRFKRL